MEDETRSVIISIPKTRVCAKRSNVSITAATRKSVTQSGVSLRKPSDVSLKKYSLPGYKPLKVSKLKNDRLLLSYRLFSKKQESHRLKAKLAISINEKYKMCSTDLRNRLYVDVPPNEVRAITDMDKKFFDCVNGRPIRHCIPLFKSIKPALDNLLRIRQEVSYRNDSILRIESNIRRELNTFESSVKRCKEQAHYFDSFILEDYLSSMAFLNKWDELKIKLNLKTMELQTLASDKFTIMSRLIGLDYRYSVQQKYGRFLYYLSPPTWRLKHRDFARSIEIEKKGFDLGCSSDDDASVMIFEKLKQETCQEHVDPALYFERPEDLLQVFETVEQQQLNYLTHVTYSTPYARTLKKGVATLKALIEQNSYSVVKSIKDFNAMLEDCFTRCNYLKSKFHKIINGLFYESVGSLDVLKLTVHLEYVYEKVLGETPTNMDIKSVAKALESCYMNYNKGLDELSSGEVNKAVALRIELEHRKMRQAKLAARELRLFNRLQRELLRSCLPLPQSDPSALPLVKVKRPKFKKGQRVEPAAEVAVKTRPSLTDAEMEYLALFTDWVETEDPADYLQQLSMRKENKLEERT